MRNPVLAGFNPDPSIVRGADAWYLVTSTFEYLPALPIYRSTDLEHWNPVGHVVTRPEQLSLENAGTPGGVWAPTLRYRDGLYYAIVSVMFPARCVLFTATDPAGPWSEPIELPGVTGIDPDLAWDENGVAHVTYAGFGHPIRQVTVDLTTGAALTEPIDLWSGTLYAPEGPHLYQRDGWWYLLIAEGGTERGHAVSVARGRSVSGPFEGYAGNPVLTARSTNNPVQNLGHADLVETPDGTAMVLLGVRPIGFTHAYSPLGRETFLTRVDWVEGWPIPRPLGPVEVASETLAVDFTHEAELDNPGWIAVRQLPSSVGTVHPDAACLWIAATGNDLAHPLPAFIGQRQRHHVSTTSVVLDATNGKGGLAGRHRGTEWFALEASPDGTVTAIATLSGVQQRWQHTFAAGPIELSIETHLPVGMQPGGDRIRLIAAQGETQVKLAELDGRYWSFETTETFTGRVIGMYATSGEVRFLRYRYTGS